MQNTEFRKNELRDARCGLENHKENFVKVCSQRSTVHRKEYYFSHGGGLSLGLFEPGLLDRW